MFDITCAACRQRYLVGTRSIRAFRNTDEGPVAVVRCPLGHLTEHEFRARTGAPAASRHDRFERAEPTDRRLGVGSGGAGR